jgi:hypothetical protein
MSNPSGLLAEPLSVPVSRDGIACLERSAEHHGGGR